MNFDNSMITSVCSFSVRKKAFFVDLFVRVSNKIAVDMYKKLGYVVYRTVLEYYSGDPDEDAYGRCQYIIFIFKRYCNTKSSLCIKVISSDERLYALITLSLNFIKVFCNLTDH